MGYKIKEVRETQNITQEALAQKSGVCRATISALENQDDKSVTLKTLLKLADALGVSVDQIFFT